jgi:leucyl/phenylalanyl-tRNA--protein transferase
MSASSSPFPNPRHAPEDGLLAYGGDLTPDTLRSAYAQGIFPWFEEGQPILWWSPDPRYLLDPHPFRPRKSLQRWLATRNWRVTTDHAFERVIDACAAPRSDDDGTWITSAMRHAYCRLHAEGDAHSIEIWDEDTLAGGLYGVAVGSCFCGESIFTRQSNGGNTAIIALAALCRAWGFEMIDCQTHSDHLVALGAKPMARNDFLNQLVTMQEQRPQAHWGCQTQLQDLLEGILPEL